MVLIFLMSFFFFNRFSAFFLSAKQHLADDAAQIHITLRRVTVHSLTIFFPFSPLPVLCVSFLNLSRKYFLEDCV
jgi:hypothetical protein